MGYVDCDRWRSGAWGPSGSLSGADEKRLNDPRGVAVDKDGNVYVADHGNNWVAVFKPDGARLGALAVDKPERLEIDAGTESLYVIGGAGVNELHKIRSWKGAKPVAVRCTLDITGPTGSRARLVNHFMIGPVTADLVSAFEDTVSKDIGEWLDHNRSRHTARTLTAVNLAT